MITPDIRAGWQEADALRKQRDILASALRMAARWIPVDTMEYSNPHGDRIYIKDLIESALANTDFDPEENKVSE